MQGTNGGSTWISFATITFKKGSKKKDNDEKAADVLNPTLPPSSIYLEFLRLLL